MFSNQYNIPKQHYRVDNYPTVEELQQYIKKAQSITGIKHCFYWVEAESQNQYTLTIHFPEKEGSIPEWWMHTKSEFGPKMLWFYRTSDLSIIYPQILQAVGAPDPMAEEEEEAKTLTERLGQRGQSIYATPGSTLKKELSETGSRIAIAKLLAGDLSTLPLSSILQTAAKEGATGRLLIQGSNGECVITFVHGNPVHATTPRGEGLEALIEVFTWGDGQITFNQGTKPDKNTIQTPVDQIVYKGAQLIENIGYLQDNGINESSTLRRANMQLSEQQFEQLILQGPPLGLELQKRFFQNLDGNRNLQDIAAFLLLSESQWIGVVANLMRLGLIQSPNGKPFVTQQAPPPTPAPAQAAAPPVQAAAAPGAAPAANQGIPPHMMATTTGGSPAVGGPVPAPASAPKNPGFPPQSKSVQEKAIESRSHFQQQLKAQMNTMDKGPGGPASPPPMSRVAALQGSLTGAPSPAVEAFMTSSGTYEFVTSSQLGIQTEEVKFDFNSSKAVWSALCNTDTRILTFEAFEMFLDREFARAYHFSAAFSLIVFSMKLSKSNDPSRTASDTIHDVVRAIGKIKNDVDIFGHFGERGYGLILPGANASQAVSMVDKITTNLTKFSPSLSNNRPIMFFGIASVPQDAQDVGSLMSNAQVAMLEASKRNVTRFQFRELTK
ncbi:MAG: DUF4388 domain-containing protein [Candidatus Obscuribacterales bacterium]